MQLMSILQHYRFVEMPFHPQRRLQDERSEAVVILLVEDELSVRELVARVLRGRGYTVLEAADGAEALSVVDGLQRPFQLLLTDVVMPNMGGRELVAALAAAGYHQRVIYMTGFTDARLDAKAVVLRKPFSLAVLTETVRHALEQ